MRPLPKSVFILLTAAALAAIATPQATPVTLRTITGEAFKISEKKGKALALAFCATWALGSDKRLPALQKLADAHTQRGIEFYWVSVNSLEPENYNYAADNELRIFTEKHGLRLPILRDPELMAYRAFGIESVPALVLLDRDGQVHSKYPNFFPERLEVQQDVTRLLNRLPRE